MLTSLAHASRDESQNGIKEQNAWILANAKPVTCTLEGLARESGQSHFYPIHAPLDRFPCLFRHIRHQCASA